MYAALRPPASVRPKAPETILVVEDDDQTRELVKEILSTEGFTVLVAASGAALPNLLGAHCGTIDLLVSDVVMPTLSGADVSERVAGAGWTPRVLFMSGYADAAVRLGLVAPGAPFLAKPFTPDALLRAVRETLDRPRASSGA